MSTNKNKQQRIIQVTRNASLRSRPLPCKTRKTWAGIILPRRAYQPTCKTSYALQPRNPRIVLPVFARSCSADGEGIFRKMRITSLRIRTTRGAYLHHVIARHEAISRLYRVERHSAYSACGPQGWTLAGAAGAYLHHVIARNEAISGLYRAERHGAYLARGPQRWTLAGAAALGAIRYDSKIRD